MEILRVFCCADARGLFRRVCLWKWQTRSNQVKPLFFWCNVNNHGCFVNNPTHETQAWSKLKLELQRIGAGVSCGWGPANHDSSGRQGCFHRNAAISVCGFWRLFRLRSTPKRRSGAMAASHQSQTPEIREWKVPSTRMLGSLRCGGNAESRPGNRHPLAFGLFHEGWLRYFIQIRLLRCLLDKTAK
jgi:hypothetical protein